MTNVSFYTDVWGEYFRHILSPGWIAGVKENCGIKFAHSHLCVNNIPDEHWQEYAKLLCDRLNDEALDGAVNVKVFSEIRLKRFGLEWKDFGEHPYQSLADLCAIDHCQTKYLVFFSGDSLPWGRSNWVQDGIELLERCPPIMAVNPVWNGFHEHEKRMNIAENSECYLGYNFSDQCYLIRTDDFNKPIYNDTNDETDGIYPGKYGYSFERRVSAYMRNHWRFRASLKKHSYITRP